MSNSVGQGLCEDQVNCGEHWWRGGGLRSGALGYARGAWEGCMDQDCVDVCVVLWGVRLISQQQKTCASQIAIKRISPTFQSLRKLSAPLPRASPTQLHS